MTEFKIVKDKNLIPNLKEAQAFVNGWVQSLKLPNGDVMLFNEEGAIREFPVNPEASQYIENLYTHGYPVIIFGNAILLPKSLNTRRFR